MAPTRLTPRLTLRRLGLLLAALGLAVGTACSLLNGGPSETIGQLAFHATPPWSVLISKEVIVPTAFIKVDGAENEVASVIYYKMRFAAQVQYLQDHETPPGCAKDLPPTKFRDKSPDCVVYRKGQTRIVKGEITFVKDGGDWRPEGIVAK
jgi:hypothetical protein